MDFVGGLGKLNVDMLFSGLDRLPKEGEELYSKGFSMQLGGGLPATLITLKRLGVPVKTLSFFGEDYFSRFAFSELRRFDSLPVNLYSGKKIPLNISSLMITPDDRSIVSYTDDFPVTEEMLDVAYEELQSAKIVQMQYPFLPLYKRLKKRGVILILDTGWEDDLSFEKYGEYLKLADFYTPNVKEAKKITGTDDYRDAARRLEKYFDKVIVKLDKDGCFISENGKTQTVGIIPEFVRVDSTGAGDAFLSGLMYGVFHGKSFAESVLFGNITGGKCVTAVGCLSAYCTESELLAYADKYSYLLK